MKNVMKRALAVVFALAMVLNIVGVSTVTANAVANESSKNDAVSSSSVYINPYSDKIVSYKPDSTGIRSAVISIVGCDKKSQIKSLKSSNKSIKVSAQDGYIRVEYPKKACSATITCTVKKVKLKTTFKVVKYTNPLKTIKIDKTNFTSKFAKSDIYYTKKKFNNKKLVLQANKDWIITGLYVYGDSPTKSVYGINKTSYSCKVSLKSDYAQISVGMKNKKTGLQEWVTIELDK